MSAKSSSAIDKANIEPDAMLNESFRQITAHLRQRERQLNEREQELDQREKTLKQENPMLGTCSDVLRLSILGTKMDVLRRTLTSVEGSLLAAQFSGRWDESLPKDVDGCFLINQPMELWKPMMDFLLDKECETPLTAKASSPVFADDLVRKRFYRMVEYYQMTLGIYPFSVCKVNSPSGTGPAVASHPDFSVDSSDCFASFALVPENGHERRIMSFEVTLGPFTSITVGWSFTGVADLYHQYTEGRGVGYAHSSIAMDCSKSSVVYKKSSTNPTTTPSSLVSTHIPGLSFTEGSVIRCEDYGHKWFVDGTLVACTGTSVEGARSVTGWDPNRTSGTPFISGQGMFRVSKIELKFP